MFFDWITPILEGIADGEVEFSIAAEDMPILAGIGGLQFEQEIDGRLLAMCDRRTWRKVKRILERAGVDYYV